MSGRRLGEILLEHGWITRDDLARALKSQQLVGGRLGTCLLESDAISEELLAQALAEQLGVDPAPIEDLRHPDPEALALLPKRLAVRCRSIPLRATVSRLDLATSEPGNLACHDEIAFATSRRVVVKVAGEARIVESLSRHYGEAAPGRFVGLVDRLNRQRAEIQGEAGRGGAGDLLGSIGDDGAPPAEPAAAGAGAGGGGPAGGPEARGGATPGAAAPGAAATRAAAPPAAATAPAPAPATAPSGAAAAKASPPPSEIAAAPAPATAGSGRPAPRRPPRPGAVTLSAAERSALLGAGATAAITPPASPPTQPAPGHAAPGPTAAPAGREPTSLAAAAALLEEATGRDEVGRVLLAFLRQFFDRVVLLAVRSDGVRGWLAAGDGVDRERLEDLAIPFDRPSVFLNLRQGSSLHLGPLPPMPAHRPLLAALGGGDPPGPCLLLPVRLGERLAAVIYGDREGAPVGGVDLDGLRRLTEQASIALERCISLKRKAHSGPAAG